MKVACATQADLEYVKNTGHGVQLFETHPETHALDEVTENSNLIFRDIETLDP